MSSVSTMPVRAVDDWEGASHKTVRPATSEVGINTASGEGCVPCLADCKACPSRSLQSTSQVPPGSNGIDLGLAETCSQCFLRSGAQSRVCGVAFFQAALCCLAGADPAWQNEVDRGSSPKKATAKVLGK